ncbi:protein kinase [Erwinia mallotivora]|uniref:Protein kinase n=1 Tax=Erwinia mallotivora TaxID=69222 RepID=A0A014N9K5_9GAMM|nr:protein kinase [Erwinia mallotivora]EXU76083.1 protein kinase [Erwinia mallotivora]
MKIEHFTPFQPLNENNPVARGIESSPECGQLIGTGTTAEVYENKYNSSILYKKYHLVGNQYNEVLSMAVQESELFNSFYGDDASLVIRDGGEIYLRMLRVPGIPLSEIETADIPDNLERLYLQLICKLNESGMIHYDLNTGNMLYDKESDSLFPIDFRDIYQRYYSAGAEERKYIDKRLQMRVNDFYSLLDRKKYLACD